MPALSHAQMDLLPLYSTCVTEMGVGERDYQETQLWHSAVVGAYSASASVRTSARCWWSCIHPAGANDCGGPVVAGRDCSDHGVAGAAGGISFP